MELSWVSSVSYCLSCSTNTFDYNLQILYTPNQHTLNYGLLNHYRCQSRSWCLYRLNW